MVYQQVRKDKVCNWTYVKESDLPEGQKLQGCGRCQEVWYVDRESQRAHWPVHKQSCRSIEKDDPSIQIPVENRSQCTDIIVTILEHPRQHIKGRLLLHVFRETFRLLVEKSPRVSSEDELVPDVEPHIVRAFFQCSEIHGREIFDVIFAIPGFASWFLSMDMFLSPENKEIIRLNKQQAPDKQIPPSSKKMLPPVYARMLIHAYSMFCFELQPKPGGRQKLEPDDISAAMVRNSNRMWSSDYVRASFSRLSGNRDELFGDCFTLPLKMGVLKKWCAPDELVPGLTAKQLLRTIMKDEGFLNETDQSYREYFVGVMFEYGAYWEEDGSHEWSHLTERDRIDLLDVSHDWVDPKKKLTTREMPEYFTDVRTAILHMITGTRTKTLLKMHDICHSSIIPVPDKRTVKMIQKIRHAMILQYLPNVSLYTREMERRARQGGDHYTFPEVLKSLIAEFAFGPRYVWASRKTKGLRFLTPEDVNAEEDFVVSQRFQHTRLTANIQRFG